MMEEALRQIRQEIESYADALLAGSAQDYAAYKELAGHLAGLHRAKQIIESLLARAERDPD